MSVSFCCTTKCESTLSIQMSPPCWASHLPIPPPRSSQSTSLSSRPLQQLVTSYLFYKHVYIRQSFSLNSFLLLLFLLFHRSILYICLSIPAPQIVHQCHFSTFHIYVLKCNIFLFLTHFTLYDSKSFFFFLFSPKIGLPGFVVGLLTLKAFLKILQFI